jgi:hypothetical protein
MQELLAGELLAHYHFTLNTQPNQVEDCLPKIDADGVNLHGMPPVYASYTAEGAANHPISNPFSSLGSPGDAIKMQSKVHVPLGEESEVADALEAGGSRCGRVGNRRHVISRRWFAI